MNIHPAVLTLLLGGLVLTSDAAPEPLQPSSETAPKSTLARWILLPPLAPYPLVSSHSWSNGLYMRGHELNRIAPTTMPDSPLTKPPAKLQVRATNSVGSTGYFRVVKGPRWLTNATAVSNALAQLPSPSPSRPLPPTGLRVISISR